MRQASLEFLQRLVNTPSPSGYETRGQKVWCEYAAPYADEIESDAYGNVVAWINKGAPGPRLMLAAHADEIGMVINYIDADGFIYVRRIGGVDPAIMKAQRVHIHASQGTVTGVVGNVAPHLSKLDGDRKVPKIEDLFIDIGATSRKEAQKRVKVGDTMTIAASFEKLHGDLVIGRALDNRIGTFAVAETLRLLHEQKKKLNVEVCVVSNIMEEVGLFGARQIAYTLHPQVALVVDVTHATDYPTVSKILHGDVRIGKGPAVTHGGCNHPEVVAHIEKVAAKQKIPLQHEAISASSGTDTDVIFWTRGGIPSGLISLPNRYMHSPVEMVHLGDLEMIPKLLSAFALSLKPGDEFKVKI